MTKAALMGTSLVAAIPGGFLAYLTIRAFVYHAEKMATMLQVVTGTTLVFSVLMALSPFAILLFVRTASAAAATEAKAASPAEAPNLSGLKGGAAAPVLFSEGDETVDEELAAAGFDEEEFGGGEESDEREESASGESSGSLELDEDEFEFNDEDFK